MHSEAFALRCDGWLLSRQSVPDGIRIHIQHAAPQVQPIRFDEFSGLLTALLPFVPWRVGARHAQLRAGGVLDCLDDDGG